MELSGQLHAMDTLPQGKEPPVLTGLGGPRAGLDAVTKKIRIPAGSRTPVFQHVAQSLLCCFMHTKRSRNTRSCTEADSETERAARRSSLKVLKSQLSPVQLLCPSA